MYIQHSTDNKYLCFKHAVQRANKGEGIHVEIIQDVVTSLEICDDCIATATKNAKELDWVLTGIEQQE